MTPGDGTELDVFFRVELTCKDPVHGSYYQRDLGEAVCFKCGAELEEQTMTEYKEARKQYKIVYPTCDKQECGDFVKKGAKRIGSKRSRQEAVADSHASALFMGVDSDDDDAPILSSHQNKRYVERHQQGRDAEVQAAPGDEMDVDDIPAHPSLLTIRVESTNMNYTVRTTQSDPTCSEILDELAVAAHDAGYDEVDSRYLQSMTS